MIKQNKSQLNQFLDDMEEIVRKYNTESESEILMKAKQIMENLIKNPDSVPQEAFKPRKDKWAINLIYMPEDKAFSVIGGVWLPGQATAIHDHMTWAVIGMYDGEEKESLYTRTDDGSNYKVAVLKKVDERIRNRGNVILLGKDTIHRIENYSEKPSLTVQVYGLDIGSAKRHSYDPITGRIETFVKGYDMILDRNL